MAQNISSSQTLPREDTVSLEAVSSTLLALARIIGNAPDEQQIQAFAATIDTMGAHAPGCRRMGEYFAQHENQPMEQTAQELGVDWTLAFRGVNPGNGPLPPYAGAWLAQDGVGVNVMMQINSRYVEKGLGCGGGKLNRMDYLGVEVEFVSHLLRECAGAASAQQRAAIADEVAQFEDEFILSWLPRYRASVEAACKTEFWKGYLELLEAVLTDVRDQCTLIAA